MTDNERHEMLTEARMFYLAAPVIMPLLERLKKSAFERLMCKYRDGDTNYTTLVAELSVLANLETTMKSKEQVYRTLEEKKK